MGRKENNIDNLDLNLSTDFNLDLDLDENKDLVFPDGNEYFKNEDSRKYRLNTRAFCFGTPKRVPGYATRESATDTTA